MKLILPALSALSFLAASCSQSQTTRLPEGATLGKPAAPVHGKLGVGMGAAPAGVPKGRPTL